MRRIVFIALAVCASAPIRQPELQAQDEAAPSEVLSMQTPSGTTDVAVFHNPDAGLGFLAVGWPATDAWISPVFPMWDAQVGDLDGDGTDELVLGIHIERSASRSVWVLGEGDREGTLDVLWRGSALARPLLSFELRSAEDTSVWRLDATETSDAGCVETVYHWNGFGFDGGGSQPVTCPERETPESEI